jgi:hypothetical protein
MPLLADVHVALFALDPGAWLADEAIAHGIAKRVLRPAFPNFSRLAGCAGFQTGVKFRFRCSRE